MAPAAFDAQAFGLQRLPTRAEYPDVDGVVLLESQEREVSIGQEDSSTTQHVRTAAILFRNLAEHDTVALLVPELAQLVSIEARTIKPDGRVVALSSSDFHLGKGYEQDGVLYANSKVVRFTFPALKEGDIVEYAYVVRYPEAWGLGRWHLDGELPILRNVYSLAIPLVYVNQAGGHGLGLNWIYKTYNHAPIGLPTVYRPDLPEQSWRKDKVTYTWTLTDIAPRSSEPLMPASARAAYTVFAEIKQKTWDDVARSYMEEYTIAPSSSAAVRAVVSQVAAGTEIDKARALYDYVRDLRYVAVMLGDSNLQPHLPDEVLQKGYGDCKDKSTLLVALLREAGIEAEPALLASSASVVAVDPRFPSFTFNHMIVRAKTSAGVVWMDPTATYCPYGDLPWSSEGVPALVLHEDRTGSMETTPRKPASGNVVAVNLEASPDPSSPTTARLELLFRGQVAMDQRGALSQASRETREEFCRSFLRGDFAGARMTAFEAKGLEKQSGPLEVRCDVQTATGARPQGDVVLVDAMPVDGLGHASRISAAQRAFPVALPYPFHLKKRVTLHLLPGQTRIQSMPAGARLDTPVGSFVRTSSVEGDAVVVEESLALTAQEVSPEQYPRLVELVELSRRSGGDKVILASRQ